MRNGDNRGWERVTEVLRQIASAKGGRGCPAAPSAASDGASSCSGSAASTPKESVSGDPAERDYVRAVLDCYLWLPGTASVTSRHDRKCARALFRRGVPLELIKSAMVVAVARRTFRSGGPLPRVRSVFYYAGRRIMPGGVPDSRNDSLRPMCLRACRLSTTSKSAGPDAA